MTKTNAQLLEDFKKELKENDKKVKEELYTKPEDEKLKEFAEFIKNNKCKVVGGKNGKN